MATKIDVAVVGGGPGGLAIARGLISAKPALKVKVFERVPKLVPAGAGLSLTMNGIKALKALDENAANQVLAIARRPKTFVALGTNGEVTERDWNITMNNYQVFVGWSVLQSILYESLPPESTSFSHRFERFELTPDGRTTLHFTQPAEPVSAQIVIGCDGYFSRLRHQWLGDGDPVFAGAVSWRGQVKLSDMPYWEERATFDQRDEKAYIVYPGSPGIAVWGLSTLEHKVAEAGIAPYQGPDRRRVYSTQAAGGSSHRLDAATRKQRAMAIAADCPPLIREVIERTDAETILETGNYYRPSDKYPEGKLGDGPITLLGDAFHVIRPTGQGVNQALEDAAVLSACLARKGLCKAALREYEAIRLPRLKTVARASELGAAAAYETDPAIRAAKRAEVVAMTADLAAVEFVSLASLAS